MDRVHLTPPTKVDRTNMRLAGAGIALLIAIATGFGTLIILDKKEKDSLEEIADIFTDSIEAQAKVSGYKMNLLDTENNQSSYFIYDKSTGDTAWVANEGKETESRLYDVAGTSYIFRGGVWQKFKSSELNETPINKDTTIISQEQLTLIKAYMQQADDEDCLQTSDRCYVYVNASSETTGWSKIRISKKTKLVDSAESPDSKVTFEYTNINIKLPEAAMNATELDTGYSDQ